MRGAQFAFEKRKKKTEIVNSAKSRETVEACIKKNTAQGRSNRYQQDMKSSPRSVSQNWFMSTVYTEKSQNVAAACSTDRCWSLYVVILGSKVWRLVWLLRHDTMNRRIFCHDANVGVHITHLVLLLFRHCSWQRGGGGYAGVNLLMRLKAQFTAV